MKCYKFIVIVSYRACRFKLRYYRFLLLCQLFFITSFFVNKISNRINRMNGYDVKVNLKSWHLFSVRITTL